MLNLDNIIDKEKTMIRLRGGLSLHVFIMLTVGGYVIYKITDRDRKNRALKNQILDKKLINSNVKV